MSILEPMREHRTCPKDPSLSGRENIPDMVAYDELCAEAERDYESFWARFARSTL